MSTVDTIIYVTAILFCIANIVVGIRKESLINFVVGITLLPLNVSFLIAAL